MHTRKNYLAEAKARALSGTKPRAGSPFEWEDWHRYSGHYPTTSGARGVRARSVRTESI